MPRHTTLPLALVMALCACHGGHPFPSPAPLTPARRQEICPLLLVPPQDQLVHDTLALDSMPWQIALAPIRLPHPSLTSVFSLPLTFVISAAGYVEPESIRAPAAPDRRTQDNIDEVV